MKSSNTDVDMINTLVKPLVGKKAWGVKIGHGSFLTMEFGKPLRDPSDEVEHGEWHLWVLFCSWRLEKNDRFLVGCEDSQEKMKHAVTEMEGCTLESFHVLSPASDAIVQFEKGFMLRLFSIYSEDEDEEDNECRPHWMLYMPDNKVLVTGPGDRWGIEVTDPDRDN